MKKKIVSLLLVMALAVSSLVACGGSDEAKTSGNKAKDKKA